GREFVLPNSPTTRLPSYAILCRVRYGVGSGCSGADRRVANLITVIRLVVLFGTVGLLYTRQPLAVSFAVVLVYIIIASDALDGIVARSRGRADEFGAIFDIAGDRVVEMTFWIVFADLDVIPVWIPLAMVTRGFLVDALRSLGLKEGKTAFGKN